MRRLVVPAFRAWPEAACNAHRKSVAAFAGPPGCLVARPGKGV